MQAKNELILDGKKMLEIEQKTGMRLDFKDWEDLWEHVVKKIRYQYYDKNYSSERIEWISKDPINYMLCACLDFAMKLLIGYDMNSRGNPELTNATYDRKEPLTNFASAEQQLHVLIKAAQKYQAAGHDVKVEDMLKAKLRKSVLQKIDANNLKQEQRISQNRFLKNDMDDPLAKMRAMRMINAPRQEPIKINTNINSESIFKVSGQHDGGQHDNRLFKTTNYVNEQNSNTDDNQNNLMGV